jgi:hypothetical protein
MFSPRPGHVRFLTPQRLNSLGAIKSPLPRLSSTVGHSFHIINTLRHFLELSTSILQASFKFKLFRRDLSLTLEWHTRSSSQALHRWSPCVHYNWRFVLLDRLVCPGVTKAVVDPKKFILSSPLWGFYRSEWIMVERDPNICELHNGDVGILCGWSNFRKKSCVVVSLILI